MELVLVEGAIALLLMTMSVVLTIQNLVANRREWVLAVAIATGSIRSFIRLLWLLDVWDAAARRIGKAGWATMFLLLMVFLERLRRERARAAVLFVVTSLFAAFQTTNLLLIRIDDPDLLLISNLSYDLLGLSVVLIGLEVHHQAFPVFASIVDR